MAKRNQIFCLSEEVYAKLQNIDNKSALVDSLLFKHFNQIKTPLEIKKEIAIIDAQLEATKKIEEIIQNVN